MTQLQLIDVNDNSYTFPDSFFIRTLPSDVALDIRNITYFPGGKNISDGFVKARTITVTGVVFSNTMAGLESQIRSLEQALLKGGKLQLSDDTVSRFITVSDANISREMPTQLERMYNITFSAEFPFWEDSSITTDTNIVIGNTTFSIDASASDYLMYPEIEIENDQGVDNPGVLMRNQTDAGLEFQYNDVDFLDGDLLVINSKTGTVIKNNNNAIDNFDPGKFLRLQPAVNSIRYEGAACTIRVKYRKVYIAI